MQEELFCDHPIPPAGGSAAVGTTFFKSQVASLAVIKPLVYENLFWGLWTSWILGSILTFQLLFKAEGFMFGPVGVTRGELWLVEEGGNVWSNFLPSNDPTEPLILMLDQIWKNLKLGIFYKINRLFGAIPTDWVPLIEQKL